MKQELIILCGIPFSGKSFLAKKIQELLHYKIIDLDEVKFQLFGLNITDEEIDQTGWDSIYKEMYSQIENTLDEGLSVVHDTGNFTVYERGLINQLAKKRNINFRTIFTDTPVDVARERLVQNRKTHTRFDVSDKGFEDAVAEMEIPKEEEHVLIVDGLTDLNEWINENLRK